MGQVPGVSGGEAVNDLEEAAKLCAEWRDFMRKLADDEPEAERATHYRSKADGCDLCHATIIGLVVMRRDGVKP